MTENDIFTKLQKIISSKMGAMSPIDSITMDSDLYHDLNMDSLDLYSILPTIEKEFDIPAISPSELDTLQTTLATKPTIRTLVNIVYKKLPTQSKKIERPEPKPTTPKANQKLTPQTKINRYSQYRIPDNNAKWRFHRWKIRNTFSWRRNIWPGIRQNCF